MTSFYLTTLGCKINQYESHALREAWVASGMSEADDPARASVILVNSCAVTARAMADVRNTVRRLHRIAPEAAIIITGCAAQIAEEELLALPGVRHVVRQSDKAELLLSPFPAAPPAPAGSSGKTPDKDDTAFPTAENAAPPRPSGLSAFPPFAVSGYDRSRAILKIQDGCSHHCAYCIVPMTRGRARSRGFFASLTEAERLLEAGFREIVVSGVNLRQYRMPEAPETKIPATPRGFWSFLSRLDAALAPRWAGRARLRISSLDPELLGREALDVLASCRMLCPHLHLSLQSGSPSVLERMGRGHYSLDAVLKFLGEYQKTHPVFGLGADILTAFPGETEEEFAEGLAFFTALPLSYAHVFPYSRRPGTRAAAMPGHVPPKEKKERAAILRDMVKTKQRRFLQTLLLLPELTVIFENRPGSGNRGGARGVSEFYVDCLLDTKDGEQTRQETGKAPPAASARKYALTAARPVGIARDAVLVELSGGKAEKFRERESGRT
jgi:MiaB/RimO family radical SAM methylthiotransferase